MEPELRMPFDEFFGTGNSTEDRSKTETPLPIAPVVIASYELPHLIARPITQIIETRFIVIGRRKPMPISDFVE